MGADPDPSAPASRPASATPGESPASERETPSLAVALGPLRLAHPFINASGTMEIFDMARTLGPSFLSDPPVAAYVAKTITPAPRAGNAPPRILETAGGLINAIGLEGEGLEVFVRDTLPRLLTLPRPLIVSVGGFSVEDYVLLARRVGAALTEGGADAALPGEGTAADWTQRVGLELNISCPNVHSGCASIGSDPNETERVVSAAREVWPGLLIAKLTPNVTDIAAIGRAAVRGGADALAAVNTFKGMVIDRHTLKPYLGNVTGGLSGPAIKPLALHAVHELFAAVEVPLIGMGGIVDAQDALDFIACGARVLAVGSGLLRDPHLASRLAADLHGLLGRRGATLVDLVGAAHRDGS